MHTRLVLYKRIAGADSRQELRELQVEMIDRFGLLPDPAKNLFRVTGLKLQANPLGVIKVDAGPGGGRLVFRDQANVDPMDIIRMVQAEPQVYRLEGQHQLRFKRDLPQAPQRFEAVEHLLQSLRQGDAA